VSRDRILEIEAARQAVAAALDYQRQAPQQRQHDRETFRQVVKEYTKALRSAAKAIKRRYGIPGS
jgi:hypothetical protein